MIKLMKYLKKSAGYIVLIIGLLFLQAYCDLSLPDYTSKVINVGIQQGEYQMVFRKKCVRAQWKICRFLWTKTHRKKFVTLMSWMETHMN